MLQVAFSRDMVVGAKEGKRDHLEEEGGKDLESEELLFGCFWGECGA